MLDFYTLATYHLVAEQIQPFNPVCQLITYVHGQPPFEWVPDDLLPDVNTQSSSTGDPCEGTCDVFCQREIVTLGIAELMGYGDHTYRLDQKTDGKNRMGGFPIFMAFQSVRYARGVIPCTSKAIQPYFNL